MILSCTIKQDYKILAFDNIRQFGNDFKTIIYKILNKDDEKIEKEFEKTGTYRMALWKYGLQFFAENPILGYGPDNLGTKYDSVGITDQDRPHNLLIQLATTSGLPGLILYVTAVGIIIIKGIKEKKGSNIVIADLKNIEGAICRYFVICTGQSPAQVEAITDSVTETVRIETGEKPVKIVGLENAQWVAMDYVDAMVHVFLPDVREYYDLENLWEDADFARITDIE